MDDELNDDLDGGGGGGDGKKGGLPLWLIIVIVAVVVGGGGFGIGKFMNSGDDKKEKPAVEEQQDDADDAEEAAPKKKKKKKKENDDDFEENGEEAPPAELVSKSKSGLMILEAFTVNLNDPFGRRYAEVVINLEIARKEMVTKINENELIKPKLRDEIFMIISSKSYNELKSTSGKVTLKEEILMRVNEILKEEYDVEPVTGVYFTKFIIQ